jgi:hypothetical protein
MQSPNTHDPVVSFDYSVSRPNMRRVLCTAKAYEILAALARSFLDILAATGETKALASHPLLDAPTHTTVVPFSL